jgi:WD40 repeat protein
MRRIVAFSLAVALLVAASNAQDKKDEPPKKNPFPPIPTVDLKLTEPVEYNTDIVPIFENKCFVCHSGSVTEGKYDMSTHGSVLKGGKKRGDKVIVPGKSAESFLYLSCSRQTTPMMPPKSEEPLNSKEVSLIKLWIDQGAKAPTKQRIKDKVIVNLPPALVKPVRAVAVAPDGKTVAASRGNQVHLFEVKTIPAVAKGGKDTTEWAYGKSLFDPQLKTPDGKPAKAAHISLVESMAFSPDGKTLITGSFQELTIWDMTKGEPKQRIAGFVDRVCCIAFTVDGKKFATGGGAATEDGEIKVFDTDTGKPFCEVKAGHSDTVFGAAFSPDGKLLATCGADKFVKVFELPAEAGKPTKFVKSFEGHTHHVMGVGWTPDGKKLASCGADNFVKVWDYEKGEKIRDMQGHQKQVTSLAFVGKTAQFLTGSGDNSVRMWNADNGGNVRSFAGAADFVYAVSASADGAIVASGCEDGVLRVYNGTNGTLLKAGLPPDAEPKKDEKKDEPKKK